MSAKELTLLELIQKFIERRLLQSEVASILELFIRHVQRLVKNYINKGAVRLTSKKRGKASNILLPTSLKPR